MYKEEIIDTCCGLLDLQRGTHWDGVCVGDTLKYFPSDTNVEDWSLPIRFKFLHNDRAVMGLVAVREVSMARARTIGAKRFVPGKILENTYARLDSPDKISRFPTIVRGLKVYDATNGELIDESDPDDDTESGGSGVALIIGTLLSERYRWRCRFRLGSENISVAFDTDPIGAREAFKLRDVPEGKKRRSALRNWVTAHRRARNTESDSVLVNAYLRGETKFNWNGFECELIPSQFDREKEIARKAGV